MSATELPYNDVVRRLRRYDNDRDHYSYCDCAGIAADEIVQLRAALQALPEGCTPTDIRVLRQANVDLAAESERNRVDAERYRWLRERYSGVICHSARKVTSVSFQPVLHQPAHFTSEMLDSMVDAALAAKDSP